MRTQSPHYHLVWQKLSGRLPEVPRAVGLLIQSSYQYGAISLSPMVTSWYVAKGVWARWAA